MRSVPTTVQGLQAALTVPLQASTPGAHAVGWAESVDLHHGDWWDLRPVGEDSLLVVADVVGHGSTASWLASMGAGALRMAELGLADDLQPYMLLNLLNQLCIRAFGETPVMSMLAARFDRRGGTLSVALAGHPPPIYIGGGARAFLPTDAAPPLGSRYQERYDQQSWPFSNDHLLIAYTDGVPNASDPEGARFGERRLLEACPTHPMAPQAATEHLQEALRLHCAGVDSTDDRSIVACATRAPG